MEVGDDKGDRQTTNRIATDGALTGAQQKDARFSGASDAEKGLQKRMTSQTHIYMRASFVCFVWGRLFRFDPNRDLDSVDLGRLLRFFGENRQNCPKSTSKSSFWGPKTLKSTLPGSISDNLGDQNPAVENPVTEFWASGTPVFTGTYGLFG